MKQSLFLILIFCTSCLAWAQPVMSPLELFYQAVFQGEVAMKNGHPRQAVAPFQRALEIAEARGLATQVREAKIRLAKSRLYARNYQQAADLFEELLPDADANDRATFHLGAGLAWKNLGYGKEAGFHYLAALKGPLSRAARTDATEQVLLCLAIELQRLEKKRRLFEAHGTAEAWFLND